MDGIFTSCSIILQFHVLIPVIWDLVGSIWNPINKSSAAVFCGSMSFAEVDGSSKIVRNLAQRRNQDVKVFLELWHCSLKDVGEVIPSFM
jgi:hypothetical protein